MDSLHDLAGKLGSAIGDHLVPKTIVSKGVVNENIHSSVRVNSLLAGGDNDGLGQPVDDTVNGIVAVDLRKVGDEVGGDGAEGSVRDFIGDEGNMSGMIVRLGELASGTAVNVVPNED